MQPCDNHTNHWKIMEIKKHVMAKAVADVCLVLQSQQVSRMVATVKKTAAVGWSEWVFHEYKKRSLSAWERAYIDREIAFDQGQSSGALTIVAGVDVQRTRSRVGAATYLPAGWVNNWQAAIVDAFSEKEL